MKQGARYLGILLGAWDTAWKVVAIHHAVKNKQWRWIVPLATVNSAGILPMLYLGRWAKKLEEPGETEVENRY